MDKKILDYMMENWEKYECTSSKSEFYLFLNIIDSHGESLDSVHTMFINGYTEICGVWCLFGDMYQVAECLFEYNLFFKTYDDLMEYYKEEYEYSCEGLDEPFCTFEEYVADCKKNMSPSFGGYVQHLYY